EGAAQLERAAQRDEHPFGRERLLEELERAELRRADGVGEIRLAAHHHDRDLRRALADLLERGEPVGAGRHHQVEQHEVGRIFDEPRERRVAVGRLDGFVAVRLQQRADHAADVGFVVDEQDARAHGEGGGGRSRAVEDGGGKTIENVAPPPGVSPTLIVPRCASSVTRTSARPSPVPSSLVVKYGSKTFCRYSAGMPGPWSAIVTARPDRSPVTVTSIAPVPFIARS